jgi:hypothetical protein
MRNNKKRQRSPSPPVKIKQTELSTEVDTVEHRVSWSIEKFHLLVRNYRNGQDIWSANFNIQV